MRTSSTYTSSVFNDNNKVEINHKTNLGHRKDHTTKDFFGESKMEPVRK